jgi:phospholipid/cholesterol/gamma-HCH transport system substrate-binding protein
MENRSHSFIAGLFVILLGVFAAFAAVWLAGPKKPSRVAMDLVTTHSIAGLQIDAPVRYRGVNVGRVESIAFDAHDLGSIRVRIELDPTTPLTHSTYAKLSYQGINGVAMIQLDDDQRGGREPWVFSRDEKVPQLELRAGLLEVAEQNAGDVLSKADQVATRLEVLLSDQNIGQVMALVDSLEQTSARYAVLARELVPTAKALPGLLQTTTLAVSQAKTTAERLAQLSADADRRLGVLDTAAATAVQIGLAADDLHHDTLPRVNAWLDQLSVDSRELEYTLHQIDARPQSFLFGLQPLPPGPGERGFIATRERSP